MRERSHIFTHLKTLNGNLISYYARPKNFNTGGVSATKDDWLKAFSKFGVPHVVEAYMAQGLKPIGKCATSVPIKHFFKHRVFSIPIELGALNRKHSLIYLHEGWTLSNFIVAIFCKVNKISYALMPHGVYEPQIVKTLKWLKIRILIEKFVISNALYVHLFFEGERHNVYSISKKAKIVIAPTGLEVSRNSDSRWIGDENYFLYAGRIDPHHKGLDLLINSWKFIGKNEKLILAGPDYNGGVDFVLKLLQELGLQDEVILIGNQDLEELSSLMIHSRGFIHISRWESYGRSPIHAISLGVPTLISDQMQISKVSEISKMAYVTPLTREGILGGIEMISKLRREDHLDKFETNLEFFEAFFSWNRILNSLFNQI
jgi:glycosyltransferase involved in cell wall biosynthesis